MVGDLAAGGQVAEDRAHRHLGRVEERADPVDDAGSPPLVTSLTYFENPARRRTRRSRSRRRSRGRRRRACAECMSPRSPTSRPPASSPRDRRLAIGFGCFGSRWKIRRHQGRPSAATIWAATSVVPQRRQNLRVGSLASPQLPQMRSPGCGTRRSLVAAGFGRAATCAVGRRAAGCESGTGCRPRRGSTTSSGRRTGGCCTAATGGRAAGSIGLGGRGLAARRLAGGRRARAGLRARRGWGRRDEGGLAEGVDAVVGATGPGVAVGVAGRSAPGPGSGRRGAAPPIAPTPRIVAALFDGPPRRAIGGAGGIGAGSRPSQPPRARRPVPPRAPARPRRRPRRR